MEVNAHHTEKLLKEINRALLPCQYQSEKLSLQSYELPAALTFRWVNAILIVLLIIVKFIVIAFICQNKMDIKNGYQKWFKKAVKFG